MARDFNGTTSRITGTITAVNTGDWTMGCWFNVDSLGENSNGTILNTDSGGAGRQRFGVTGTNTIIANNTYSTTAASSTTTDNAYANSVDTLCIATFRASDVKCRIYFGTLATAMAEASYAAQVAGVGTRSTGGTTMVIGDRSAADRSFDGRLSRVFFVPREFSLDEMERFRLGDWFVPLDGATPRFYTLLDTPNAAIDFARQITLTESNTSNAENPPVPWGFGGPIPVLFTAVTMADVNSSDTAAAAGADALSALTAATTATDVAAAAGNDALSTLTAVTTGGDVATAGNDQLSTLTAAVAGSDVATAGNDQLSALTAALTVGDVSGTTIETELVDTGSDFKFSEDSGGVGSGTAYNADIDYNAPIDYNGAVSGAEAEGVAFTQPDTGASAENQGVAFTQTDTGAFAEGQTVDQGVIFISSADTRPAATEAEVGVGVSENDTGASDDVLSDLTATLSLADTGASTETATSFALDASDTITSVESETIAAELPSTDTGSSTDDAAGLAFTQTDTVTVGEALQLAAAQAASDIGTRAEAQTFGVAGAGDTGTSLEDVSEATASLTFTDTGTSAEDQSAGQAQDITSSDTGSSAEALLSVTAAVPNDDLRTSTETVTAMTATMSSTDTGAGADVAPPDIDTGVPISGSDPITSQEQVSTLTATLALTEPIATAENQGTSFTRTDTGTSVENQGIGQTGSEAITVTDQFSTLTVAATASDTGASAEAQTVAPAAASSDAITSTEAHSITALVTRAETVTRVETVSAVTATAESSDNRTSAENQTTDLADVDSITGAEEIELAADFERADSALTLEDAVLAPAQSSQDAGGSTESQAITVPVGRSDQGAFAETESIQISVSSTDTITSVELGVVTTPIVGSDSAAFTEFQEAGPTTEKSDTDSGEMEDLESIVKQWSSKILVGSRPMWPSRN